jgi:RNA polymerase sigma-70 factor (ECF subfamily)
MIDEAQALLAQASRLDGQGRYELEAAVQSAHPVRRHTGRSDWAAIVQLYDLFLQGRCDALARAVSPGGG